MKRRFPLALTMRHFSRTTKLDTFRTLKLKHRGRGPYGPSSETIVSARLGEFDSG